MTKQTARRKAAADVTLPRTPVSAAGKRYDLCLDLGALAAAESEINQAAGFCRVNLLLALPSLTLSNLRIIFACALRVHHPEIDFETGVKLLQVDDLMPVAIAMREAWAAAIPEPEASGADPTRPGK